MSLYRLHLQAGPRFRLSMLVAGAMAGGVSESSLVDRFFGAIVVGGPSSIRQLNFEQASPSAEWIINHNFGFRPSVEVFSVGGAEIDTEILHTSLNQTRVRFNFPTAGSARLT